MAGVDDTEQVPLRISQDDKVRVVRVLPVDPLSAEGDETVHLGELFCFVGDPKVEVRSIVLVKV